MSEDNVLKFPGKKTPCDSYVEYRTNESKMQRFNDTIATIVRDIQKAYPEIETYDLRDLVLTSECFLNMVMRAEGVAHPLQKFSNDIGGLFLTQYD